MRDKLLMPRCLDTRISCLACLLYHHPIMIQLLILVLCHPPTEQELYARISQGPLRTAVSG